MAHRAQAVGDQYTHPRVRHTATVVADFQDQKLVIDPDDQTRLFRLRMFENIGQGLLRDPEDTDGRHRIEIPLRCPPTAATTPLDVTLSIDAGVAVLHQLDADTRDRSFEITTLMLKP